jgi:hypothetical protein
VCLSADVVVVAFFLMVSAAAVVVVVVAAAALWRQCRGDGDACAGAVVAVQWRRRECVRKWRRRSSVVVLVMAMPAG